MHEQRWVGSDGRVWRVHVAVGARERSRGLRGLGPLADGEALLLPRCRSVQTVGLAAPIDAVLLDDELVVRDVVRLRPGRVLLPRRGVRHVLEVAAGSGVAPGDRFVPMAARPEGPTADPPRPGRPRGGAPTTPGAGRVAILGPPAPGRSEPAPIV
ncbi:MAG: hypothetical protein KatS3mg013_1243 [Actinomycetota bacterium]|jgi:uncharacterized membrane protein (UPF0127 family)|nr:MAG: hypothetical protein KatS3mg013_1243 [Actinomycetota bacterium]